MTLATMHDMRYTTGHIVVEDHPPMATLEPEAVTLSENPAKFAVGMVPYGLDEFGNAAPLDFNAPAPVYIVAEVGGGITWGAPTAVAVTAGPASTTLIAANANRKAISIWSPIGNAQMSVDIKGGTAVLATGRPMMAGDVLDLTGSECPVGAITFIGTAAQSLVYQEGT